MPGLAFILDAPLTPYVRSCATNSLCNFTLKRLNSLQRNFRGTFISIEGIAMNEKFLESCIIMHDLYLWMIYVQFWFVVSTFSEIVQKSGKFVGSFSMSACRKLNSMKLIIIYAHHVVHRSYLVNYHKHIILITNISYELGIITHSYCWVLGFFITLPPFL